MKTVAVTQFNQPKPRRAAIKKEGISPQIQDHIVQNSHFPDQRKMLLDHADPFFDGFFRRTEIHWLSFPEDLAAVGSIDSKQDIDQRSLARAVLSQKGMDLSFFNRKTDIVVCINA